MKNIVIFGAPGSGKGTQSDKIIAEFGVEHISQSLARLLLPISTRVSSFLTL